MKTKLPMNFEVTDDHRNYCAEKWGHPKLADAHHQDFIECFLENGRKHTDWDRTFKNFIRNNAPGGRFHGRDHWESKIARARSLEGLDRKRTHRYDVRERAEPPATRSVPELAQSMLAKLRAGLR